jgi:hypothetical protein
MSTCTYLLYQHMYNNNHSSKIIHSKTYMGTLDTLTFHLTHSTLFPHRPHIYIYKSLYAGWAYLLTMMICMAFMHHTQRRRYYFDIPDATTTTATIPSSSSSSSHHVDVLPMFHTQEYRSYTSCCCCGWMTKLWFRIKHTIGTTTTPTKKRRGKDN